MTRPKKIAIFLHDLRGGGAERMMMNLAGGIAKRGIAIDLVLANAEGPYLDMLPPDIRVVDLALRKVAFSPLPFAGYLRKERPTAVLSALLHVNVAAILGRMLAGRTRLVISERNTVSADQTNISSYSIRLARLLAKSLYRRADAIVAVSHGVARDLSAFTGIPVERIDVVNNPVVTQQLLEQSAQAVSHPWLQEKETPVILAVGRLSAQKDFATLLEAFALVRRARPVRLIVLGEGEERIALSALAEKLGIAADVDLPGFAQNPYAYMSAADLFVLSSRWEGSPNVLVEAMACGTAVVSTNCPSGPEEILAGGTYGPLVPIGDADRLAEAMVAALDNPTPSQLLQDRASDYSVERSTKGYLDVLLRDI